MGNGTWRISAGDEHQVMDEQNRHLVSVPCGGMSGRTFAEATEAARIIAAAPDLLAALQGLLSAVEAVSITSGFADRGQRHTARAAIAKALGQEAGK